MTNNLLDHARDLLPRRWAARAAALAVLLALAGAAVYGAHAWTARATAADRLAVATVSRGDLEDTVTATGILQPRDYVDVGTQVSGQLMKLHVEIGSTVKAGQLIAEIDPTVYVSKVEADQAELRNQQAQLQDKQSQLTLAEQQHDRQVSLMKDDATTQDALQTAEATLRSAQAQIEALKAQIEQTQSTLRGDQANLSYTKIYAPMSGTVVAQSAKQGQTLNANQQAPVIVRIADLSTMTVQSQVSEADVSSLRPGMPVYFTTLGEASKRWYGKLRQINPTPETVNNVVLYDALFDVDNRDGALMTQMTAQVFFVAAEAKNAVLAPVAALRPASAGAGGRHGGSDPAAGAAVDPRAQLTNSTGVVQVVKPDGGIEPRTVHVGLVSRVSAQVVSGLELGESIVVGQRPAASAAPARPATGNRPMTGPRV
ncbi:MAG TPA: efflux RND transporter periplasmic adaptor subunit [Candidatus Methylomirabilis sp.]|nr:efflux RND transporter periplasmic adaptor subunit [Candidatus Methylomirabilis sp.]